MKTIYKPIHSSHDIKIEMCLSEKNYKNSAILSKIYFRFDFLQAVKYYIKTPIMDKFGLFFAKIF